MIEKQSSYRNIMKATSLFGGVQVFNIIISIVRSKFIAILLGPAGMGIAGLLTSTTGLITGITNFGLGTSAVKNVSAANATGDSYKISVVISVLRRLVWVTGILGMIITIFLAPLLSQITFGNKEYTIAFICVSIILLTTQLNSGQLVVLQGMRKLKQLATADFLGMVTGLLVTVPFYYFFGVKGIVPAIVINAFFVLFFSWFFSSKIQIKKIKVTREMLKSEGWDMLRMGVMINLSFLFASGTAYITRIYISHTGGVEQVGLYTAGFAIITTYVGMIFSAMATDYYPRLSATAHDNTKSASTINQQAEIAVLILAPILSVFLTFIKWGIILLYSKRFIAVGGMIQWAALGMFFKAASWAIAFIFMAKGATRIFFWSELIANVTNLLLNIIGYKLFGLDGLGIAFLVGYFVYFLQVYFIAKVKYFFTFENIFYKILIPQLLLNVICFIVMKELKAPWSYFISIVFIVTSFVYSYIELDRRIGLKLLFKQITNKFKAEKEV